ncbi:MAG: FIST C-terminal domain-containing protein [Deltaproteobacteria bacterium]|nr:FIST C-terminal domain-containing protein [Deltaproteobacteria bacterium]
MRWISAVSTATPLEAAVREAADAVAAGLDGATPDLVAAFVSEHHQREYERLPALVRAALAPRFALGCSAGGVIGGGRELERQAGVSLTAAVLPGVDVRPFHLESDAQPSRAAAADAWERATGVAAARRPAFVLLPDPFTFDAETLVAGLDAAYPASPKIGGLASGGREPGANALYLGDAVHRSGAVGIALAGNLELDTVVAQGCRPIGEPMFVTRADQNVLHALDGKPALAVLQQLVAEADARDRQLFASSLFLGVVMQEQEAYRQGDFLIRNLLGIDGKSGAIAVGAALRTGMVVQFHLRDAATSAQDLDAVLSRYGEDPHERPAGSLIFSCLGRGEQLYGTPDHDTRTFQRHLGRVPLGGFFCNGEIGPVHGRTFLHGYTSAFGVFRSLG